MFLFTFFELHEAANVYNFSLVKQTHPLIGNISALLEYVRELSAQKNMSKNGTELKRATTPLLFPLLFRPHFPKLKGRVRETISRVRSGQANQPRAKYAGFADSNKNDSKFYETPFTLYYETCVLLLNYTM